MDLAAWRLVQRIIATPALPQKTPDPSTLSVLLDPDVVEATFEYFTDASSPGRAHADFREFYQNCMPWGPAYLRRAMSLDGPPGIDYLPPSLYFKSFMELLMRELMDAALELDPTESAVAYMRDRLSADFDAFMQKMHQYDQKSVLKAVAALQASSCDRTAVLVAQYLVLRTVVRTISLLAWLRGSAAISLQICALVHGTDSIKVGLRSSDVGPSCVRQVVCAVRLLCARCRL